MQKINDFSLDFYGLIYPLIAVTLTCLLIGCGAAEKGSGFIIPGNKDGRPADTEGKYFRPGLEATYLFNKYRHVDHMHTSESGIAKFGKQGEPILFLDHRFADGEVFASGKSKGVGVLMKGYFNLEKPGAYQFQARSNDGFQLYIDGKLIVSDPDVHGDRLSEPGEFEAIQGGMFPVAIKYFQRKGTATLELYWQPPGTDKFVIVPPEVYRH